MKEAAKEAATTGTGFDFSKLDPETAKQLAVFQNPEMLLDQPKLEQLQQTLPKDIQPVMTQMIDMLRDALSSSLTTVFLSGTALLTLALVLVFFLREIPLRTSNKIPQEETEDDREVSADPVG
jgi:hypothetical protein